MKAIKLGDKFSNTNLGSLYKSAGKISTAIVWYKKAVEANEISGCYYLAMAYFDGEGVEKNGKEAERLLLIGANKNDYLCMSGLELLCKSGCKGMGKSKSKANEWNEKKCKAYPQYCK